MTVTINSHHIQIKLVLVDNQGNGDSVDNTVEENSSVFFLIRMRWLQSATACGQ